MCSIKAQVCVNKYEHSGYFCDGIITLLGRKELNKHEGAVMLSFLSMSLDLPNVPVRCSQASNIQAGVSIVEIWLSIFMYYWNSIMQTGSSYGTVCDYSNNIHEGTHLYDHGLRLLTSYCSSFNLAKPVGKGLPI